MIPVRIPSLLRAFPPTPPDATSPNPIRLSVGTGLGDFLSRSPENAPRVGGAPGVQARSRSLERLEGELLPADRRLGHQPRLAAGEHRHAVAVGSVGARPRL